MGINGTSDETDEAARHDVIVVGAGMAGLLAALRVSELRPGTRVLVVDAGRPMAERERYGSGDWGGFGGAGLFLGGRVYIGPATIPVLPPTTLPPGTVPILEGAAYEVRAREVNALLDALGATAPLRARPDERILAAIAQAEAAGLEYVTSYPARFLLIDERLGVLRGLRERLAEAGVTFRFGTRVTAIERNLTPRPPLPRGEGVARSAGGEVAEDEERISTVGLRKAIAARMVRSATTIPQFTEYSLFDAGALVAARERLKGDAALAGAKLTYLPFFVRALVQAVSRYPILNSRWDEEGNAIVVKKAINVGIATDTPRGLLVPVIHDAQTLDLAAIAREAARLVELTRAGTITAPALTGGTITITNVGAAGPADTGAPLINPPEASVVGFGAIKPRPMVVGERVEARPSCWISISCDHRIVDGATAAQFMGALVEALEQPEE